MNNPGSGATGKYQFMPDTLRELIRRGKLKGDQKFTNEAQDQAALDLIQGRQVNLSDGLSLAEVQELAWEWASIKGNNYTYNGVPQGKVDPKEFLKWYEEYGGTVQRQTGGTIGASPRGIANLSGGEGAGYDRLQQAQASYNEALIQVANQDPIIVYEDEPVPTAAGEPSPDQDPPTLPDGPSTVQAAEYFYNLNFGGSF